MEKAVDSFVHKEDNMAMNTMAGMFGRYYKRSRSFIADVVHVGPILLSVQIEKRITKVLVRSLIGFREYMYYNSHISECKYFYGVRMSLDRYFNDCIEGWGNAEAVFAKKANVTMAGMFKSLFLFGGWSLKNDHGRSSERMYDVITTGMMSECKEFCAHKIMERMAEIGYDDVESIDNEIMGTRIYVDVVLKREQTVSEIVFGKRFHGYGMNMCKQFGMECMNENRKGLRLALLGFILNEVEYFNQLNEFYSHNDLKMEGKFADVFRMLTKVYLFEVKLMRSLRNVLMMIGANVEMVITDLGYFEAIMRGVCIDELEFDEYMALENILNAFDMNFEGFECYMNLMLSQEDEIEWMYAYKGKMWIPDERSVRDCICKCLQRIVRYPILLEDILKKVGEEKYAIVGLEVYTRIVELIGKIDKRKEEYDSMKYALIVNKNVEGLKGKCIEKGFLYELNCMDVDDKSVTLFLFSDVVIISDRHGSSLSICDVNDGRYVLRCILKREDVEIVAIGKCGLKVITGAVDAGEFCQIQESYEDVFVGAMYFKGCSEYSRKCFIDEYIRSDIGSMEDVYSADGEVFFRMKRSVDEVEGRGELLVCMDVNDFRSVDRTVIHLDADEGVVKMKNIEELEVCQDKEEILNGFVMFVKEMTVCIRARAVCKGGAREYPDVFARYRMKLREIVEKYSDSGIVEFEGDKCTDEVPESLKTRIAKAMMGYLSRQMSYFVGALKHKSRCEWREDKEVCCEMKDVVKVVMKRWEVDDMVFSKYDAEEVLCLLMYFIKTNVYSFLRLRDIQHLYRMLFVENVYSLTTVVDGIGSKQFVCSLFDVILYARGRIPMIHVLKTFSVIFYEFELSDDELSEMLCKIYWDE
ncbi:hypothetical protein CWI42_051060 [Ordospora colligata]|uniref:DH domain-containing protein n=1 Tax=Ordospora colligata OC4 TaxID=1354746 RepID=A0A0B2UL43_9MICR|nr:uncharacterized protein M896_051090 [Ordospora colligata OC4]KHN69700.1 hypothetical protein M896_051090 [Ordospora colligata OC4]TBU15819.1 hypothetical protein CWI41_051080 [Ordospora colligata]TBU15947.1 hypothetical protein CWI40_051100 [Ordospora colligata]TBU18841.1 hypothetical protein CWI42_051060 [Ordospora colligata]